LKKREAEAEARNGERGIWNPHGPQVCDPHFTVFYVRCRIITFFFSSGKDSGIQHAIGLTGVYDHLEGEPNRWYVSTSICHSSINAGGTGIVENVRDGSTVRVRMLLSDNEHQFVNIAMAGVRAPRASTKQGEPAEQWGEEVICF
jgi:endonuclease YncB( thermonuclease family)